MQIDYKPYFEQYLAVVQMADDAFARVQAAHPENVKCKIKCADCCHALFDITLIEAIYLNQGFQRKFEKQAREAILEKANRADRKAHMIKRQAYKDMQAGKQEVDILMAVAAERCRCPLLNDEDRCDLYDQRPITCRLYGIPTSSRGLSHTCGLSGFKEGQAYPTVNLDMLQQRLYVLACQFTQDIRSRFAQMGEMVVPVSMALLTTYDDEYLGIKAADPAAEKKEDHD